MADEADMQVSPEETPVDNTADSQTEEQSQAVAPEVSDEVTETTEPKAPEVTPASETKEEPSTNQDEKVDLKPLSRRSAAYRIQQLATENKQLKEQLKPAAQTDEWDAPAEDETQPDIAALIAQEVEKRLHPVISESSKNADDGEIAELFSGDKAAERTSFEPRIREMWQLPQYKEVAASDLYKIAKFDELSGSMDKVRQQAVEDYKKANKEAKESSSGGTSNTTNRTGAGAKSVADMTDEEFRVHNERVKAGLIT